MNERDIDLVLALAENRLPADQVAAAEAHIASNPELARELEAQRAAIAAVAAAPPVAMTAAERAGLHATVRSELNLEPAVATAAAATSGWARWFAPLAGGLAVAAVVIGAFVILPSMSGGDDDAFDVAATTAASEEAGGDGVVGDATSGGAEATTTTAASALAPAAALSVPRISTQDLEAVDDALREGTFLRFTAGEKTVPVAEILDCLESLTELEGVTIDDVVAVSETGDVLYVSYVTDGTQVIASIDFTSCEVLDTTSN